MKNGRREGVGWWIGGLCFLALAWEMFTWVLGSGEEYGVVAGGRRVVSDWLLLGLSGGVTSLRAISGALIGAIVGTAGAMTMVLSRRGDRFLTPVVDLLRPLPSAALILLWASMVRPSSTLLPVVAFGTTWPVLLAIRDRARTVLTQDVRDVIQLCGMTTWEQLRWIHSRALLPGLLDGFRVALGIALILAVTVEIIVGSRFLDVSVGALLALGGGDDPRGINVGIGQYLGFYYGTSGEGVVAAVMVAGAAGLVVNGVYHAFYLWVLKSQRLVRDDEHDT